MTIGHLISPAKKIPTASSSDLVGAVLENVKSSHDPVFVYDNDAFLGLVSGSYVFFKKRYPLKTKLSTSLINPPHLTGETSIYDVTKHMVSTGIYTLPVFDKDKIVGVITAGSILKELSSSNSTLSSIRSLVRIDKPVVSTLHARIRDVYATLKNEKTSRIIVMDEDKKEMKGIVTRSDIQQVFMAPPSKGPKNRTKNNRAYVIDDKDLKKLDFPIAEFVNIGIVTLPSKSSLKNIIKTMIDKRVNSVVLTDRNKPTGIVSLRSILTALSKSEKIKALPIKLSDKHQKLLEFEKNSIIKLLDGFGRKITNHNGVRLIESTVDTYQNTKGKVTGFEFHLRVHFMNGDGFMTKVEGKVLLNAVHEAIKKIDHQIRNSSSERKKKNK